LRVSPQNKQAGLNKGETILEYKNRMMQSDAVQVEKRKSGFPSIPAGECPKCKAPLYYASRLVSSAGVFENVDYCSAGCGFTRPAAAEEKPEVQPEAPADVPAKKE
jgi:hypothetical protein